MKKIYALCAVMLVLSACKEEKEAVEKIEAKIEDKIREEVEKIKAKLGVPDAPPPTPKSAEYDRVVWLEQGWSKSERLEFHHKNQGSALFVIPYELFMVLRQPGPLFTEKKFHETAYLERFGFIPGETTDENPDGLPVGFAKAEGVLDYGTGRKYDAIGLTCAACHTGQLNYNKTNIRIDGGAAVTSLTQMVENMALSLVLSSDIPLSPRKKAFKEEAVAKMVAKYGLSEDEAKKDFDIILKSSVERFKKINELTKKTKDQNIQEGFTRLDALNRIGNTVFGVYKESNWVATDAPVNYPVLWSTSWFDWVQYDGSIMQPMIRNAGESMGLATPVQLAPGPGQFQSAVAFEDLHWMESLLEGDEHPQPGQAFTGLLAPPWPEDILGPIDRDVKAKKGAKLYEQLCQHCHLPPVKSPEFWTNDHWQQIGGKGERYLTVKIPKLDVIGTDPAQAHILANRTVDIDGMDMNGEVCGKGPDDIVPVQSTSNTLFAFALGLAVERTNEYHYDAKGYDKKTREMLNGDRPNCLQAGAGYKARPLNGVWATAPFLHNSSVANLYEMLVPAGQRASTLYLGHREFDPVKVGYISTVADGLPESKTKTLTEVIVSGPEARKGNFNSGHEFRDGSGPGIIGRLLTEDERWQLVEYLKTL